MVCCPHCDGDDMLCEYCHGRPQFLRLWHRGCGGDIVEDWEHTYEYDVGQEGTPVKVPSYWCQKCKKEILGDPEMEGPEWFEELFYEEGGRK